MKAKWRMRWTGLALLVAGCALNSVHALDRSDLLFQAGLDGRTDAGFARGDRTAQADYQPRFIDGVRGQAAVVGPQSGRVAPPVAPVDYWLDVAIPVTYRNPDIGALRYAQAQNLDWREGTLAFWAKPLDWASGDGANHYLAHFNMRDMLSFVYSPYVGWVEFRRSRISDRNDYCKFLATRANLPREAWSHIAVAWRGQELWTYLDGELCKTVSEGVPRVEGGGEWLAFGEANAATTAFDEMLTLNRAVTPVEAEALFRRTRQGTAGPVLTVPATTAAPVLDGKLAADEYARAARVTGWIDELLGVGNDDPTEFLVNYDETHLHVAVRFPVPAKYHEDPVVYVGNPLRLKAKGEDADLSGDDHIEIVLRPAGSSDEYRFGLTGAGARFDARNGDRDWDGDWRWQTHADEESWMVEIALPFALFGRPAPARGEQWEANFRHRALQVIDWGSIWAYSGPEPNACGTLVFGGDGPFVKIERLIPPRTGAFEVAGRVVGAPTQPPASWMATVAIGTNTVLGPVPEAAAGAGRPDDAEVFRKNLVLDLHAATGGVFKVTQVLDRPLAADLAAVVRDATGRVVFHQRIPFADSVTTTMGASMLPSRGAVLIEIDAGSIAAVERGLGAAITILNADGRTVREQTVARLASVLSGVTLDVADLPAGVYTARVQLQAKDQARAPMEQAFEIWPKPEWLGNTIGITDEVLPPWTPLAYTGGTLSCWGRQLDVGQSLLPERIDVLGETLFAAPPALTLTAGGKTNRLSRAAVRFTRRDPQRAEFTAETETPGFRITTENWIEYDGFQWITLTVTPKQPGAEVQDLTLELPFRREIATHWFNGEYRPDSLTGYLPDKPLRHGPANLARFGTAERGLQWCWQETYRWRLEKPAEALELLPGPDAYRVRLTFIDHAVKLNEP